MAKQATLNSPFPWINAATFRFPVTLLSPVTGTDISGSNVTYAASEPPVTAWCKIDYLRGDEKLKSGIDVTQNFLKLTTWYDSAFNATAKVQTEAGNLYTIQDIENVSEMGVYMVLTCLGIGGNN